MTAFATISGSHGRHAWTLDVKSVNGRGLDVKLRLPGLLDAHEAEIRKAAGDRLTRGTVSANLRLETDEAAIGYVVDDAVLDDLVKQVSGASRRTGIALPSLDALLRVPGVLRSGPREDHDEGLIEALLVDIARGFHGLGVARAEEGERLKAVLSEQLDALAGLAEGAETAAANRPAARAARLREMVAGLDTDIAPERLAQETALIAVKIDVREELDRLRAHVASGRELLSREGAVGRRLEFLSQELNREANTLCAKSGDADLTRIGMEMKVVVDQFREQAMNVE